MTLLESGEEKEKATCGFENDMRNLGNFHQSTQKSQNRDCYWVLLSKIEMPEIKIYRGVMCYDNEK